MLVLDNTYEMKKKDFALWIETWYSDDRQHHPETSDLNQLGYKLSVVNRQFKKKVGGISMAYRTTINMSNPLSGSTKCFEYGTWRLILRNITLHVMGLYRPPPASTYGQFVVDFFYFMEKNMQKYSNLLITGDFNVHLNDDSNAGTDFKNSL